MKLGEQTLNSLLGILVNKKGLIPDPVIIDLLVTSGVFDEVIRCQKPWKRRKILNFSTKSTFFTYKT